MDIRDLGQGQHTKFQAENEIPKSKDTRFLLFQQFQVTIKKPRGR